MAKPLPTEFEGPEESPGFLLWQVTNLWQRRQRAALKPLDLTHVQFVLLASLTWMAANSEAVTQVELAEHARTDVMMTSQVLRTLEEKGLIARAPNPRDSRAKCLSVTDQGRVLAEQAIELVEAVDRAFFAVLGDRAAQLVQQLRQLLQAE